MLCALSFTGRIILAYCQVLTGSSDERFARIIREAVCAAAEAAVEDPCMSSSSLGGAMPCHGWKR
jgi:hypothetical protein